MKLEQKWIKKVLQSICINLWNIWIISRVISELSPSTDYKNDSLIELHNLNMIYEMSASVSQWSSHSFIHIWLIKTISKLLMKARWRSKALQNNFSTCFLMSSVDLWATVLEDSQSRRAENFNIYCDHWRDDLCNFYLIRFSYFDRPGK